MLSLTHNEFNYDVHKIFYVLHCSLTKNVEQRPKFHSLASHPFIVQTEKENVNVAHWYKDILQKAKANNAFLPPHVVVD